MMRLIGLLLFFLGMTGTSLAQAQDSCPVQLQESQYNVSITDNQRAAAVRDLAKANRIIADYRAKVTQLEQELAKAAKQSEATP